MEGGHATSPHEWHGHAWVLTSSSGDIWFALLKSMVENNASRRLVSFLWLESPMRSMQTKNVTEFTLQFDVDGG